MSIPKTDQTFLAYLQERKIPIDATCNGKGTCGKCKVRFIDPIPLPSTDEIKLLEPDELSDGIRLACRHTIDADTTIERLEEAEFMILGSGVRHFHTDHPDETIRIAIDIGTTTVVLLAVDGSGNVLDEIRFLNPQRAFGADVLSRIQASQELGIKPITDALRQTLETALVSLFTKHPSSQYKIGVTGNPTMTHFFMQAPVEPIIRVPYSVSVKETKVFLLSDIFPALDYPAEIIVYPPISAYVGADILCGLVELDFFHRKGTYLFLDLGTNGELVLLKDGIAYATSTAAGPAFEGGNLSCGCGSIDGAIHNIFRNDDGSIGFETISDEPPVGICGSGYIDLFSVLLGHEMDEGGHLGELVELTPEIGLTQQDVRMFQLAKAAIRTGIEILLKKTDTQAKEIERFDLAGGFGSGLRIDAAINIGLFPKEFDGKVHTVGNTALRGTMKLLLDGSQDPVDLSRIHTVELADEPSLMDEFVDALYFN
ncbi:MAG TPA: [Fe-S]-binding protein [Erysipelotrichaceae bacterium]|nr:MAG: hypothetical protein A2Y19_01995 [Firmicutes bacterium GWE2_51_13]HBZ41562.1 [Fe-S]-binding protein [Erysipelotrichaceae bacterium]